jgi:fatty-acid desaturase
MDGSIKLRLWQIFIQVSSALTIWYAYTQGDLNWLWVSLCFYWLFGVLGSNICYHKMLSHNTFKTYTPIKWVLITCGLLATNCSPLAYVITHRTHHKYSDKARDPHSPITRGKFKTYFVDWFAGEVRMNNSLAKKELRDKFFLFTHRWYTEILVVYFVVLACFDWYLAIFTYAFPATILYHVSGLLSVSFHTWGYRNFDTPDNSRNNWLMHLITLGDGLHNNHHKYPGRYDAQIKWWEIDFPAKIIKLIKKDRK